MKRATIKISLDTNSSSQYSDGSYPVVLQIGHNRRIFRKRIGLKAIPKEWDNERYVSDKRVVRNYKERNDELNELEYKAQNIISTHFKNTFNYKYFSKLLEQDTEEVLLLNDVAQNYIDELYSQERAGTAMYYECVLSSLKSYKDVIILEDVNRHWIKEYVKHNTMRGVKCIAYLRGLKAIYGYAIKEYDLDYKVMPFKTAYQPKGYDIAEAKKIKVRKLPPKNGRLIECFTEEELETMKNYMPDNEGKARAYSLFMFSYYTGGVNAKDIALMKYEDVRNGVWFYKREKTGQGGKGKPLSEKALEIIDSFKGNNGYVFPWILNGQDGSERQIKKRLSNYMSNLRRRYNKISKECEFDGHFSFYTARITAATMLANKGANLKAVQIALDHSNLAMTSKYIRRVDNKLMEETLAML